MVDNFLELSGGLPTSACDQIGMATHIRRIEAARYSQLVRYGGLKQFDCAYGFTMLQSHECTERRHVRESDGRILRKGFWQIVDKRLRSRIIPRKPQFKATAKLGDFLETRFSQSF